MELFAVVAGALFFIGDIYVLGLIFKRLFAMVKGTTTSYPPPMRPGEALPKPYEELPTTASPSKTHVALLVLLKFTILVPLLILLLSIFEKAIVSLFLGMFIGLVIVCVWLYFVRRSKAQAQKCSD